MPFRQIATPNVRLLRRPRLRAVSHKARPISDRNQKPEDTQLHGANLPASLLVPFDMLWPPSTPMSEVDEAVAAAVGASPEGLAAPHAVYA